MRRAVVLFALAGVAHAQPSRPKHVPDKFTKAASDAFSAAAEADARGDLRAALGLYEKAHAISAHPSTIYNIADVQRRLVLIHQAIRSYEMYLAMAPNAKDRVEVEALIDQLAKTPGTLQVFTSAPSDRDSVDLAAGYLLVDGALERKPGPIDTSGERPQIVLRVPPGEHVVDFVTTLTHAQARCEVEPGANRGCKLEAAPRIDGNAVISTSERQVRVTRDERGPNLANTRVELPAGKHRLLVNDRGYHCLPLKVEISGANQVVYTYLQTAEYDRLKRCRAFTIQQHRLQFEP